MLKSFEEIKQIIAQQVSLAFPDFKGLFFIYTDALNYQLGAVIMQHGKPLAFFSRKLTNSQRDYTVGEQELLAIVEML